LAALRRFVHGFVHPKLWVALGVLSLLAFVATLVMVPIALARLPKDYFLRERAASTTPLPLRILKNALGVLIVLVGVLMLVLPGQGIITIALGLGLVDFPGRRRLELAVIGRPGVIRGVNALRRKLGREPLELPHRE
jgi:putative transmembrane protein PGPGW